MTSQRSDSPEVISSRRWGFIGSGEIGDGTGERDDSRGRRARRVHFRERSACDSSRPLGIGGRYYRFIFEPRRWPSAATC